MEHYAGIDVSLELSSVCVVDAQGKIVKEALRRQTGRYLLVLSFAGLTLGGQAGQKMVIAIPCLLGLFVMSGEG